jgi:hypothetical protein
LLKAATNPTDESEKKEQAIYHRMSETSDNANAVPKQPPLPTPKDFARWFWAYSTELHRLPSEDFVPSKESALRLYHYFARQPSLSEDEAKRNMKLDRAGTLSLYIATFCEAHSLGWDLPSTKKLPATKPCLKWDYAIFQTSGAFSFFHQAIEKYVW